MDYSNFEVEDFASDDYFIRWVIDNDLEAALFWETYALNDPAAKAKIDKARLLLLTIQKAEDAHDVAGQVQKTWENIRHELSGTSPRRSFSVLKIAASVSVIAIVSFLWYGVDTGYFAVSDYRAEKDYEKRDDFTTQTNTTGSTVTIRLSDGTVVRLENNSRLEYLEDYKDAPYRKVHLTGEAFFEVARNRQQPFIVYANEVVTKVLGTSFRVTAYDGEENVLVSVKEGKVSVYSAKSQRKKEDLIESEVNGVVLMPNQQVSYERTEDTFNKTLVESPEIIREEALEFNFEFRNAPVKDVFEVLAEAYGVEIIFDEEGMENCYLTVPLGDEPLFEKLKIVCRTIGATYELIDANIVISSKGCGVDEDV